MSDGPRRIDSILNQLMARRGYLLVESASALEGSVKAALGPHFSEVIRVGDVKRGVLQIYAKDSPTMQELTFQKRKVLKQVQKDHPQAKITDLRLRVG